jgi:hypothetical protein
MGTMTGILELLIRLFLSFVFPFALSPVMVMATSMAMATDDLQTV